MRLTFVWVRAEREGMNQSIWCPYHNYLHDLRDDVDRAPVSRSLDHLHEVTAWFASDDREVVECVVCGDQWGVA